MRIHKYLPKSIKSRLTMISVSFSLLLALAITSICYIVFQNFLQKNVMQSVEFNLQLITKTISNELEDNLSLARWASSNLLIRTYLEHACDPGIKPLSIEAYDRLKEEYQSAQSAQFVNRIIITDPNGHFLQITNALEDAHTTDGTYLISQDGLMTSDIETAYTLHGIQDDPFIRHGRQQILPVIFPVSSYYSANFIGFVYLSINTQLFLQPLNDYTLPSDSRLFLTINDQTYCCSQDLFELVTDEYSLIKEADTDNFQDSGTRAYYVRSNEGKKQLLITYPSFIHGLTISQIVSESQLKDQRLFYYTLLIFIFLLVLGLGIFLMLYTKRLISIPIRHLQNKLDQISNGDFSRDYNIEWDHELGQIGKGINKISQDVVLLMDKRVADEQQKKDLEYQMLQSQIDPHFIYNTLNSIKWMATIQNASGIAEMTTSLARLLKNASKGASGLVTIREELNLINDYFLIQKYRYGGTITLDIQIMTDELYQCLIPRFTLQPLIENALFHGLEPKGRGAITLKINEEREITMSPVICIQIIDNGIGMTKEQIERVFDGDNTVSCKFFKQLGIHNVHQRIRYEFGAEYGITIISEPGEFTNMTIRIHKKISE